MRMLRATYSAISRSFSVCRFVSTMRIHEKLLSATLARFCNLQEVYPLRDGVPLPVARPVILLIVRHSKRMLGNNDEVGRPLF